MTMATGSSGIDERTIKLAHEDSHFKRPFSVEGEVSNGRLK